MQGRIVNLMSARFPQNCKAIFASNGAVKIMVSVKPNAKETAITEIGDAIGIRLAARPKVSDKSLCIISD
jgi:hypothetical protein